MDDNRLIGELERIAALDGGTESASCRELVQTIKARAGQYQQSARHWLGISLAGRARLIAPGFGLDRSLALLLGGKAELVLNWADALRIVPSPALLALLEADLHEAIAVDSTLPDPAWDLAVISARYRADYAAAAKYLGAAVLLGYRHPMTPRLAALIQAKPAPQPPDDSPAARLRRLVLELAVQAVGPQSGMLLDEERTPDSTPLPGAGRTFGDYVAQAIAVAAKDALAGGECLGLLADSGQIAGDAGEYVADLLRRLAEAIGPDDFLQSATERHLGILARMAFAHFDMREEGEQWIRRSRRAAQRGLDIVGGSRVPISPNVHADLLIALGQALYYEREEYAAEAIRCYQRALRLKREAGNATDVARLKDILWKQIEHRVGRALVSRIVSGVGAALEVLAACAEVAEELEDPVRALGVKLPLATLRREVGQHQDAETLLHEILASAPSEEIARDARFELASVYSETSRPREAAALQKALLDEHEKQGSEAEPSLWSNYSNSLRLLGDFDGARLALEKAWQLLPPEQKAKLGNTLPAEGARTKTLLAQLALETGDATTAMQHIEAAAALDPTPFGLGALHYYETRARCLLALGRASDARSCLDTALHNFKYLIGHGPSLPSWESLLHKWSHLDALAVRAHVESGADDGAQSGLLRAESTKGRVLAWLERRLEPESAEWALGLERQQEALACAREWLQRQPGRRVVSLFGSDRGLGVFGVESQGSVTATWLDDFNYDRFRAELFEPWEEARDRALTAGTPAPEERFEELNERLLDAVGALLERAQPLMGAGGDDLVVIPHRLFRNLPISHARLPGAGCRLSELFKTVVIAPGLNRLGGEGAAGADVAPQGAVAAFADADGSLPFARCEALLCASPDAAIVGERVTTPSLREAFRRENSLLLSLHGEFDRDNPFLSRIHAADGPLPLHEGLLRDTHIRPRVVVLGVCEAGRSRRSLSDEPLGFPALFLQGGARMVLAPLWEVDDFASFLFMTRVFGSIAGGTRFAQAVGEATQWLRTAPADAVSREVAAFAGRLSNLGEAGIEALARVGARLKEARQWLASVEPSKPPFASPLDWMAFQVIGSPED